METVFFLLVILPVLERRGKLRTQRSKIRADKRGDVVVGNRQFLGAMATADWYNRLLGHRGEGWREGEGHLKRGGSDGRTGGGTGMEGPEAAALV